MVIELLHGRDIEPHIDDRAARRAGRHEPQKALDELDALGCSTMASDESALDREVFDLATLESVLRGTLGVTGEGLFRASATQLAALFSARCVIMGEVALEGPDAIRSLVTYVDGRFTDNLDYPLGGTAWRELIEEGAGGLLLVEHGAAGRYPGDRWLAQLAGDRLFGVPLVVSGIVVGVLAVVDATLPGPLAHAREILGLFAGAVAAEVSRVRVEAVERTARISTALAYRSTLLALAQHPTSELQPTLQAIIEADAVTLGVERVSYWALAAERTQIQCEELYQVSSRTFTRGTILRAVEVPAYFEAMLTDVSIIAHDARRDPRTAEFTASYFEPNGITSMLDVPVWRHGRVAGVLCHEHVGSQRTWRDDEIDFATSAAGLCSLALEAAERRHAEQRYELMARTTNDVLWDWDLVAGPIEWSAAIHTTFRHPPEQVEPSVSWWHRHIHADERDAVLASLRAAVASATSKWEGEYRFIRGDGTLAWVIDRGVIVRDPRGHAIRMLGVMVDVTERKEIEARLLIADRMASIGTLAAGVAHEVNNPLAYIIANIDFALDNLGEGAGGADLATALHEARDGAVRVRTIVNDLRTFSRGEADSRGPVDLQQVIEVSINMAWNEIRHRARLVKDFGATSTVQANEGRLAQLVLNLLVNAAQAIPEGAVEDNEIRVVTGTDQRGNAIIEVRDTGPGIPLAIRERVFDPFFTTKPVGLGTGLGLAICHTIVSELGGEISIGDAPGYGCVVRVSLPQASAPHAVKSTHPSPEVGPGTQRPRILVIDDDVRIGTALQRLLRADWDTVVVTGARAALELLAKGARFDVALCDLMMPDMTGMELHAALCELYPELAARTVFMTGVPSPSERASFWRRPRTHAWTSRSIARCSRVSFGQPRASCPRDRRDWSFRTAC
jgi:PAS domain S-box-containing protein